MADNSAITAAGKGIATNKRMKTLWSDSEPLGMVFRDRRRPR